jgi:hypothetical protein
MHRWTVIAALVVIGCGGSGGGGGGGSGGGGGGGSGGGGGTSGPPGWTLFYPESERTSGVVALTFTPHPAGSDAVMSAPAADDPWRLAMTDRSFDLSNTNGGAHAEVHLSLAIAGDTITVSGSASATSDGTTVGSAIAQITNATLCYRPPSGTKNVRFTATMSGTPTATGTNSLAYLQIQHFGTMDCAASEMVSLGTPQSGPASCTSASEDVLVDSDGQACLNGDVDEPSVQFAAGGGDASAADGGSATVSVTFTIKATPL